MKTSNQPIKENGVITKKDLKTMFWRSLPMEFSWHYERQMHMGFCTMISQGLKKIYKEIWNSSTLRLMFLLLLVESLWQWKK